MALRKTGMGFLKWAALAAALLVLFTGCARPRANADYLYSLRVTVSSWSGWEPDYEPEEATYDYELDRPGPILAPPEDGFKITITEMDPNGITFKTEVPMAPEGAGINLDTDQTVFTVYSGQTLSLVTPTTDYGDIYIIEFVGASRK